MACGAASNSYTGLFGVLTDLGFTIAATQRMAGDPEREAEWLGALVDLRIAMSVLWRAAVPASIPLLLTDDARQPRRRIHPHA